MDDISRLDSLSQQELLEVIEGSSDSPRVKELLREVGEDLDRRFILKEHAFGAYWRRRFELTHVHLGAEELELIVSHPEYETAQGALGEAALLGLLTEDQCRTGLLALPRGSWGEKQVRARLVLIEHVRGRDAKSCIDAVIGLKAPWALLEMIPNLVGEDVSYLRTLVDDNRVLTRSHRHDIKELLKRVHHTK